MIIDHVEIRKSKQGLEMSNALLICTRMLITHAVYYIR